MIPTGPRHVGMLVRHYGNFEERYCPKEKGFARIITDLDHPFYGTWANPSEGKIAFYHFQIFSGFSDMTGAELAAAILKIKEDMKSGFIGIDWNPQTAGKFTELGLKHLFCAKPQDFWFTRWLHPAIYPLRLPKINEREVHP